IMGEYSFSTMDGREEGEKDEIVAQVRGARLERAVLITICVLGIFFNTLTLLKRRVTRPQGASATRVSLSLLRVMAGADTVCLTVMLLTLIMGQLGWRSNRLLGMIACKLNIFIVHTTSAISLYCWLVLSLVRYAAVFSPFKHLQLDRQPFRAVLLLAFVIGAAECWLLVVIEYDERSGACVNGQEDDNVERRIQIAEILLTYFLPLAAIVICDVKVLRFSD
ncbi:hypothetical protein PMAYCL1PPCAC_17207, partial [Pristionchus mayeri]